jgi:hypothetical protein
MRKYFPENKIQREIDEILCSDILFICALIGVTNDEGIFSGLKRHLEETSRRKKARTNDRTQEEKKEKKNMVDKRRYRTCLAFFMI